MEQQPAADLLQLVMDGMGWEKEKARRWFSTDNPLLGGVTPNAYVLSRGKERLEKFIRNQLSQNKPAAESIKPNLFVPCQNCMEHYLALHGQFEKAHRRIAEQDAKIAQLENKLASKCEYHIDYGSDVEALIDELTEAKSDLERQLKEAKEEITLLQNEQGAFDFNRQQEKAALEQQVSSLTQTVRELRGKYEN